MKFNKIHANIFLFKFLNKKLFSSSNSFLLYFSFWRYIFWEIVVKNTHSWQASFRLWKTAVCFCDTSIDIFEEIWWRLQDSFTRYCFKPRCFGQKQRIIWISEISGLLPITWHKRWKEYFPYCKENWNTRKSGWFKFW